MRFSRRVCAAALLLFASALPSVAQSDPACTESKLSSPLPPSPPIPGVTGGDGFVYILGKPEMVASGRVTKIVPNATGRYALVVSEEVPLPPGPETGHTNTGGISILLWDSVARKVHTLWEQPALQETRSGAVTGLGWFYDTDSVMAVVTVTATDTAIDAPTEKARKPVFTLLYGDVSRDSRLHPLLSSANPIQFMLSPKSPFAIVADKPEDKPSTGDIKQGTPPGTEAPLASLWPLYARRTRTLNARGRFAEFPNSGHVGWFLWGGGGSGAEIFDTQLVPRASGPPAVTQVGHWYTLDAATGVMTQDDSHRKRIDAPPSESADKPLRLFNSTLTVTPPGSSSRYSSILRPLWLRSDNTLHTQISESDSLLVSPDGIGSVLLPDLRGILYSSRDALYSVPLIRMTAKEFETANGKALVRIAITNGGQIGQALTRYAKDNDQHYPPAGNIAETLAKYLKDPGVLNNPATGAFGFSYLLHGDATADVGRSADRLIGYLTCPGGRANLYADQHVAWVNDPPATRQ